MTMPTIAPVPREELEELLLDPDWALLEGAEPAPAGDEAVGDEEPVLPCDPGAALPVDAAVPVRVVPEVPAESAVCAEGPPPLVPATGVGVPVGLRPGNHEIVSPSPEGSDAMLANTVASWNATVADAEFVQLQVAPGCSVDGFPGCEQMAHAPSLLSHRVRATHG
jgi:hypothetical protein